MIQITDLFGILPHRYPFLLIDRVIKMDPVPETDSWVGRKGTMIKNVTINEPFFVGHFPDRPIMPGVLVIEAMAQASAVLGHKTPKKGTSIEVMFIGIDKARFRRPIIPGDQLRFEVEIIKHRGPIISCYAQAFVDDELAAEAELLAKTIVKESVTERKSEKLFSHSH